jgi:hypothetical protein
VKLQGCAVKVFQVFELSFSHFREVSKDFFQNIQSFERIFGVTFVIKMSSFQMEY